MSQWKPDQEANRVDLVGGFSIPRWAGMNLEQPPFNVGDNEFQLLENVRWREFSLVPRGGQSKFYPSEPTGDIYHYLWGAYGGVANHGGVANGGGSDFPEAAPYDPT